jgi:4-hydroxybenzoate polyprenyltransferase
VGLLLSGGVLMALVSSDGVWLLATYVVLNGAYTLRLKQVAIVDITFIAIGFVIRLMVGAVVTGVELSEWIIVMTFLLALFLSLAKRRDDVIIHLTSNEKMRKAVDGYNLAFLDSAMVMTAAIVVLAYVLWSLTDEVAARMGEQVYLTSVFVVLGVLRYMQIALVEEKSGNPSRVLLRDRFLQGVLAAWLGAFVWLLYLR